MKRTKLDAETGQVRCPKCGASQFTMGRTLRGKVAFGVLAPKRAKCMGCGKSLKTA